MMYLDALINKALSANKKASITLAFLFAEETVEISVTASLRSAGFNLNRYRLEFRLILLREWKCEALKEGRQRRFDFLPVHTEIPLVDGQFPAALTSV